MKKIITTVGTSLFTNYNSEEIRYLFGDEYKSISDNLEKLKNIPAQEFNNPKYKIFIDDIEKIIKEKWLWGFRKKDGDWTRTDINELNYGASAEIKSLFKLKLEYGRDDIVVILLATDTILSKLAAQIIFENIKIDGMKIEGPKIVPGLQVYKYSEFKSLGFNSLINTLKEIVNNKNEKNVDYILNISGGYKAIIPILTVFSQLYGVPAYYIYEESEELLAAPSLPIQHDWGMAELFYPYLNGITQNSLNLDESDYWVLNKMKKLSMLRKRKNIYKLTPWGKLYKKFIDEEHPIAKNTLGFFVEYKLYEYFITNPYYNKYTNVTHSEKFKSNTDRREIDIVLRTEKDNNEDIIVGEIKSLLSLSNRNKNKIIEQIGHQIAVFQQLNIKPKEYLFIVYSMGTNNFKSIQSSLIEIDKIIKKHLPATKFLVKTIKIETELNNRDFYNNPYQKFLQQPFIKITNFKFK